MRRGPFFKWDEMINDENEGKPLDRGFEESHISPMIECRIETCLHVVEKVIVQTEKTELSKNQDRKFRTPHKRNTAISPPKPNHKV